MPTTDLATTERLLDLASALIARPSVTPADAGCQDLLAGHLEPLGFACERLRFGEVDNLWARRGSSGPLLVFAGHTDVVPSGPEDAWQQPPFAPLVRDGELCGRGAADMKGSLAAMVLAIEAFLAAHPEHPGSIALLITSDEEGPAKDGTRRVMDTLADRGELPTWCVVGEPSSQANSGDVVRNGRRGSLNLRLTVHGVQGHVAYPEDVLNPIHAVAPALAELASTTWDEGNAWFPPTSFQVSNITAGTGATNVVPGSLEALCNFRFSTASTADGLMQRTAEVLERHGVRHSLDWQLSGEPFITGEGRLLEATRRVVQAELGKAPVFSTGGGTSDGRFIAPHGVEVVELGPPNATIHQVDERVPVAELSRLVPLYQGLMQELLCGQA